MSWFFQRSRKARLFSCPIDSGNVVSWLERRSREMRSVNCPIDFGNAVSWLKRRSREARLVNCPIDSGNAVSWFFQRVREVRLVNCPIASGNSDRPIPDRSSSSHCSSAAWAMRESTDGRSIGRSQRYCGYSGIPSHNHPAAWSSEVRNQESEPNRREA